jgi:hypothetical protein
MMLVGAIMCAIVIMFEFDLQTLVLAIVLTLVVLITSFF